jgi:hypothetical protein
VVDKVAGFLQEFQFPLPILILTAPPSSSCIIQGWYNRPNCGQRTKWTQVSHYPKKLNNCYNIITVMLFLLFIFIIFYITKVWFLANMFFLLVGKKWKVILYLRKVHCRFISVLTDSKSRYDFRNKWLWFKRPLAQMVPNVKRLENYVKNSK